MASNEENIKARDGSFTKELLVSAGEGVNALSPSLKHAEAVSVQALAITAPLSGHV